MSSIIPLVVLIILAIPIVLIVSLVSLGSRLRELTQKVQILDYRLLQAEQELARVQSDMAQATATPFTAPAPVSSIEELEQVQSEPPPAAEVGSFAAEPPLVEPTLPLPSLVEEPTLTATIAPPPLRLGSFAESASPDLAAMNAQENQSSQPVSSVPAGQGINWEQFMGVKLFAWLGGFALFLGVAFFIKYSFERNLIPPELRVAMGFVTGIGLLVGGVLMKRRELAVTSQTLCATGIVILYAVTFSCRSLYHFTFFGAFTTFLFMVLITATAFTLAVELDARVVAVLGMVGGFLTPLLVSSGQDNPLGLFSYIALLDLGLLAVALRRRWHFLILLGAVGTLLMEMVWVATFFEPPNVFTALAVFLSFDVLFLLGFLTADRWKQSNPWATAAAIALPFVTFGFTLYLLSIPDLGARPGVVISFAAGADLCLLALVLSTPALERVHLIAGSVLFLILAYWTGRHLTPSLLYWALGLNLGFAALHTAFPVLLARLRPETTRQWWGSLFPALSLVLILIPLFQLETVSWVIWPAVLLIDVLAIALAVSLGSIAAILLVLFLTVAATATWIAKVPSDLTALTALLSVTGGFALLFFGAGIFAGPKILARLQTSQPFGSPLDAWLKEMLGEGVSLEELAAQVPALSAILPFCLLIMVSIRLPLANPSPVFGLALILVVLLLGLALFSKLDTLGPVSLACLLALEHAWYQDHFTGSATWPGLLWAFGFYGVYTVFPFLFAEKLRERVVPWATAALAGPLHFYLIYKMSSAAWNNPFPGLLPAALSIPMLSATAYVMRRFPTEGRMRLNLLAWFGASALFFLTLIFPIQFSRQWITLGWGLEGLALVWLFTKVPHPGLRATGVVLLLIAFARLGLNPAVLEYHRNGSMGILNWYLCVYGIISVCLLLSARLLAPPRHQVWNFDVPPLLYTLGTVLLFILVNIEIADYFSSDQATLAFQFSGNFARDMTYSIAWGLFALGLLVVGIWKRLVAPRYSAIGLLAVTLAKLFLHDLSQLNQLYRIGAFLGVAVILMLSSYLYQRFVSFEFKGHQPPPGV